MPSTWARANDWRTADEWQMELTVFGRRGVRHIRIIFTGVSPQHRMPEFRLTGVDAATHVVAAAWRDAYSRLSLRGAPLHVPMVAAALGSGCEEFIFIHSMLAGVAYIYICRGKAAFPPPRYWMFLRCCARALIFQRCFAGVWRTRLRTNTEMKKHRAKMDP